MVVRLLKIRKENDKSHEAFIEDQIVREQMESIVKEKLIKGEATQPRSIYDNYRLYLDKDIKQFKRDNVKPYIREALHTNQSNDNDFRDDE